jgi:hypothetical protein
MPQSPVWALTTTEWLDHIWCDMPQRDTRTLHTHLRKVLLHLLKWRYQPWQRFEGHSWLDTILEQRRQLALLLGRRPSLRRRVPEAVAWAYSRARRDATAEPHLPLTTFPEACPWTIEQVLDDDFWPVPSEALWPSPPQPTPCSNLAFPVRCCTSGLTRGR